MQKLMGIPVNKFICASNENKVLTDFINTGVYDIKKRVLSDEFTVHGHFDLQQPGETALPSERR